MIRLYDRDIDLGPTPSKICRRRWEGSLSPEPETVAWIESLTPGKILYDIGANVGTHSARAALRGLQVVAFEPVLETYIELSEIITRNKLPVLAYNLAVLDRICFGIMGPGRSTHTFHPYPSVLGGTPVIAVTVDFFAQHTTPPDYLKIDIDGDEPRVLQGAVLTLPRLTSLIIEIDPHLHKHQHIPSFLADFGFRYDKVQVESCRVKGGKYDGLANWVFFR